MNYRRKIYRFYDDKVYPKIENVRGAYTLGKKIQNWAIRGIPKISQSDAESVFEKEDWDNLLILDACRHDVFEEVIGEKAPYRYSLGSASIDFVERTFSEGDYSDVVVVTANPHFYTPLFKEVTGRDPEDVFHTIYHTYETDWSDEERTVMPEKVLRDYVSARKLFPDKKILVHFMQPHNPFVAADLEHEVTGFSKYMAQGGYKAQKPETEWTLAEKGVITKEEVWDAYKDNTRFIIEFLNENKHEFKGKTIVTADHGNFAGESGFYGHPGSRREVPLRKVPWIKLEDMV